MMSETIGTPDIAKIISCQIEKFVRDSIKKHGGVNFKNINSVDECIKIVIKYHEMNERKKLYDFIDYLNDKP